MNNGYSHEEYYREPVIIQEIPSRYSATSSASVLVLGILGLVFAALAISPLNLLINYFGWLFAIFAGTAGIILCAIAIKKSSNIKKKYGNIRGRTTAGKTLAIIGLCVSIAAVVIYLSVTVFVLLVSGSVTLVGLLGLFADSGMFDYYF